MPIQPGDRVPEVRLDLVTPKGAREISTREIFDGKRVVLFAVPGAFSPTCSDAHLPGFQVRAHEIKSKGVDTVACVVSNDVFVVRAWARARGIDDEILMLADGDGDFARALDLETDLRRFRMGARSRRYSAIVENGVVRTLHVEEEIRRVDVSSAERIVAELDTLAG